MAPSRFRPLIKRTPAELREVAAKIASQKHTTVFEAPSSQKNAQLVWQYWNEYKTNFGERYLAPTCENLKAFFENLAAERPGQIGERLSLQALEVFVWRLKSAFRSNLGVVVPTETCKQVINYIRVELKAFYGLSNKSRPKPLASSEDIEDHLKFLWVHDSHFFHHPRTRAQVACYLLLLAYTAARPGAVVVSDCYRNSNQSLTYQDVKFYLNRDPAGGPPIKTVHVDFRWRKGERFNDGEDGHVILALREDLENPGLCPLVLLFAFALTDEVFSDMDAALRYCDEPIRSSIIELKVKESAKNLPVLRMLTNLGARVKDIQNPQIRAWTYSGCHHQLTELGFRMGYEKPATSYAIRRQCANVISANLAPAQAGKILGQRGTMVLQRSYISTAPLADVQSLVLDKPMVTADIKELQRLKYSNNLNRRAPHRLTKEQNLIAVCTPEIDDLIRRGVSKGVLKRARERARREYKLKLREEFFQNEGVLALDNDDDWQTSGDDNLAPCRARVVELLYNSPDLFPRSRQSELIKAMVLMCTSSEKRKDNNACRRCVARNCGLHSGFGKVPGGVSLIAASPFEYQSVFCLTGASGDVEEIM